MIWRDDDIGADTNLEAIEAVDDLFQRYGQVHTIAVMAHRMDTRPDLVSAILDRGMDAQLHCWRHDDLSALPLARRELAQAVELMADLFGKRPTVLYPTWNRTSPELEAAASALGLTVSATKISLPAYIRAGGAVAEEVVNFHYWHPRDVLCIEPALKLATGTA